MTAELMHISSTSSSRQTPINAACLTGLQPHTQLSMAGHLKILNYSSSSTQYYMSRDVILLLRAMSVQQNSIVATNTNTNRAEAAVHKNYQQLKLTFQKLVKGCV